MERLLIVGASGHGKVVADVAMKMNQWKNIAFLDDDPAIQETLGYKMIGASDDAFRYLKDSEIFIAVGNNETRERLQQKLEAAGATIPVLVHPSAIIGYGSELGFGTVVMAGAIINCCTKIGKGCIINTGATIDHDNVIEDYVHISPGANLAGTVKVGKGTWLGIGSVISNNINIAGHCKIGAGTVVIRDIVEPGTYVGNPHSKIG